MWTLYWEACKYYIFSARFLCYFCGQPATVKFQTDHWTISCFKFLSFVLSCFVFFLSFSAASLVWASFLLSQLFDARFPRFQDYHTSNILLGMFAPYFKMAKEPTGAFYEWWWFHPRSVRTTELTEARNISFSKFLNYQSILNLITLIIFHTTTVSS